MLDLEKQVKFQQTKKSKYGAKKTTVDGIVFDSKAESIYYLQHKNDDRMTMQEKFVLMDKFRLNGKLYREIAFRSFGTAFKESSKNLTINRSDLDESENVRREEE